VAWGRVEACKGYEKKKKQQKWDLSGGTLVLWVVDVMPGQMAMALAPEGEVLRRDRKLVRFVGRHGAVAIEHVMATMGVGRTAAYRRVGACVERGLLERLALLRGEPSLLRATRAGLRYAGLGLGVAVISPGSVDHWLRCASTSLLLSQEFGADRILTERELRLLERIEGRAIASARIGELPGGKPRLHRPDLVVLTEERPVAIEVELTPKAPGRLEQLIRAWRRASCVAEVHYLCAPGATRRAVERAVEKTRAEGRIQIEEVVSR
jgi:hypothetical protein